MLEVDHREGLNRLLAALPCRVQLPASWAERHHAGRERPLVADDNRRFCRAPASGEAICELLPSLPAVPRNREIFKVIMKDVSRGGIGFLASLQLFPCEEFVLWTPSARLRCRVARCLKLDENCFEIGATYQS